MDQGRSTCLVGPIVLLLQYFRGGAPECDTIDAQQLHDTSMPRLPVYDPLAYWLRASSILYSAVLWCYPNDVYFSQCWWNYDCSQSTTRQLLRPWSISDIRTQNSYWRSRTFSYWTGQPLTLLTLNWVRSWSLQRGLHHTMFEKNRPEPIRCPIIPTHFESISIIETVGEDRSATARISS